MRSFSGRWWDCWINDLHGPSAVFIKEYLSGDYAAIWEAITNDSIKITTPTEFGKAGAGE